MKILVTGANGMLGQDLCPALEDEGFDVIETDIHNLDILNKIQAKEFFENKKPDMVIHCAAYTNVDKAEEDIKTAELINVIGTENIAELCANSDIPIVYISTDYVFDGTKKTSYLPTDIPNPLNNYGLTKLKGEEAVKKLCKKYYIARTSWLYGHHGKNFVETMINLAENKSKLRIVDDQIGSPTWTVELCSGIIDLIESDAPYGIYHVCGSGKTSWFGFAKEIFNLVDINIKISPVVTSEFPRPAKRPAYSVMDNDGICRDWKDALKEYIALRD